MTKSKMLPFLPEEKSNHIAFWSLTKKDGVFSLLNGDRPFHSRPALRNFTRLPTTSETGSRARSSSRNCGVNRMVIRRVTQERPKYMALPGVAFLAPRCPGYPQGRSTRHSGTQRSCWPGIHIHSAGAMDSGLAG